MSAEAEAWISENEDSSIECTFTFDPRPIIADDAIRPVQRRIGASLQVGRMKINQLFISGKRT